MVPFKASLCHKPALVMVCGNLVNVSEQWFLHLSTGSNNPGRMQGAYESVHMRMSFKNIQSGSAHILRLITEETHTLEIYHHQNNQGSKVKEIFSYENLTSVQSQLLHYMLKTNFYQFGMSINQTYIQ